MNRHYDPSIGRWLSKDPSGFGGGDNFYAYTDNDPVNYIDPEGEVRQKVGLPAPGVGDLLQGGFGAGGGYIGPISGSAIAAAIGSAVGDFCSDIRNAFSKKESKKSKKAKASDAPSFARGENIRPGESASDAAEWILNANGRPVIKGPNSEFSQIKKYLERK